VALRGLNVSGLCVPGVLNYSQQAEGHGKNVIIFVNFCLLNIFPHLTLSVNITSIFRNCNYIVNTFYFHSIECYKFLHTSTAG
jgi:hypothetical protein